MGIASERIDRIRKRMSDLGVIGKDARVGTIGVARTKTHTEAKTNGDRNIVSVATTDAVDCDVEIIVPQGIDWSYYNTNRANFMDHRYDTAYHVGSMRSIKLEKTGMLTGWVNRSTIFKGMKSSHADDLWTIATTCGIGCSIGYAEPKYRDAQQGDPQHYDGAESIVGSCKGLELSFTAFPCNVGCRSGVETDGMDEKVMGMLDSLVTKSQIRLESAVALGFAHNPERTVVGVAGRKLRPLTVFVR